MDEENQIDEKLKRKRELAKARMQKYRKRKQNQCQQLNSSKQDDHIQGNPTREMQNKQAEENHIQRKREMGRERSRRYRERKRLNAFKSVHHGVHDSQISASQQRNSPLVSGSQRTTIHDSQIGGTHINNKKMNSFSSIKEEIDPAAVNNETKTEKFMSSENNINLYDAEYFSEFNNCQRKSVDSWNTLTWKCSYCYHIDSSYEILLRHLQSIHQISNVEEVHFECTDCGEALLNYASFLNHVRCAHYETLKLCCDICSERFSNYKELAIHREVHLEISRTVYPVVYHCSLCEKVHSTEKELKLHTQLHHSLVGAEERERTIM